MISLKKIVSFIGLVFITLPKLAFAHVRYIATESEQVLYGNSDYGAFFSPLQETKYVLMIIGTLIFVVLVYLFWSRSSLCNKWTQRMAKVGESYKSFIPWITRLSLGIILIGGATNGFLISPVLSTPFEWISTIQLVIGFFLMSGFMVGFSAVVVLGLFILAISYDPYLIGSFDILALIISLFILDSRRPGIDDIIGIPDFLHIKKWRKYLPTVLRIGIGIGMSYLAIVEKIMTPNLAAFVAETTELVNVIPVSSMMWAFSAGVIELAVGILLIIGWKTRIASVAAIIILSMSFFYFGEDVASHVTLFGTLSAVFILGVGPFGIDKTHSSSQDSLLEN